MRPIRSPFAVSTTGTGSVGDTRQLASKLQNDCTRLQYRSAAAREGVWNRAHISPIVVIPGTLGPSRTARQRSLDSSRDEPTVRCKQPTWPFRVLPLLPNA